MQTTTQYDFEETLEQLKLRGIRMTPQRTEIIRLLMELSHPTPEQLYQAFIKKYPHVSYATIYNNLKVLRDLGYIQELPFGDHSSRFEWTTDAHYHFICTRCDSITDIAIPAVSAQIEELSNEGSGFQVSSHRLELYGTCPNC